jgi:sugar-specific transcriptional regulator TrmB
MTSPVLSYLRELGLQESEAAVYLSLTKLGEAPASHVAKNANLPRTTAISILEKFHADGLVSTHKYKGVTYYWIESPEVLKAHYLHKAEVANELGALMSTIYRSEAVFPSAEVHDTRSAIRAFIEKTLAKLTKEDVIYTIDTPHEGNYTKIYSDDIENIILKKKRKRDALTQTLIPYGTFAGIAPQKYKTQRIVIKELPPEMSFTGSLWIIGDTTIHFSGNPPFVVAFKHKKITEGMKGIFDFLWSISRQKLP